MDLDGKVAVVTGASTGIGRAAATAFARRGMKLVLAARRTERLRTAVAELHADGFDAVGVPTDVAELEQVRDLATAAYDAFGRVDVAFFNAGSPSVDRLVDPDLDVWRDATAPTCAGCRTARLSAWMLHDGAECTVLATTSGAGFTGRMTPRLRRRRRQLSIMEALRPGVTSTPPPFRPPHTHDPRR